MCGGPLPWWEEDEKEDKGSDNANPQPAPKPDENSELLIRTSRGT